MENKNEVLEKAITAQVLAWKNFNGIQRVCARPNSSERDWEKRTKIILEWEAVCEHNKKMFTETRIAIAYNRMVASGRI